MAQRDRSLAFSVDAYIEAFDALGREGIPSQHRALLQAHFESPEHTATWERLAGAVGYVSGRAVNLQYGTLARRVARQLGLTDPPQGFWLFVLADWGDKKDASGHTAFVLRQPVVEALTRLGILRGLKDSNVKIEGVDGKLSRSQRERRSPTLAARSAKLYTAIGSKDHGAKISELGFPPLREVAGRLSVAEQFGRSKRRSGVYLLGFRDSVFYIGKAIDVVRRFSQHRRVHDDICAFTFLPVRRRDLDITERDLIHSAERLRLPLTNNVHVSGIVGETDLDALFSPAEQRAWLEAPTTFNARDTQSRLPLESQRLRTSRQYARFALRPDAARVAACLTSFISATVPAPFRTEYSFWSLSCLPSGPGPRLACLCINMMEVLTIGCQESTPDHWAFINISEQTLRQTYPGRRSLKARHPGVEERVCSYRTAGYDQVSLDCLSLDALSSLLIDPAVQRASAHFNLRLMRKGAAMFSRYHCVDLATTVLAPLVP